MRIEREILRKASDLVRPVNQGLFSIALGFTHPHGKDVDVSISAPTLVG
jgi:hypothetical protein